MLENHSGLAEFYGGVRRADCYRVDSWQRGRVDCLRQDNAGAGAGQGPQAGRTARPYSGKDRNSFLGETMIFLRRLFGFDVLPRIEAMERRASVIEATLDDIGESLQSKGGIGHA